MRKTVMMALRDSERASLGKHFNIIGASFVFVYPFPFTHFSRRLVSFCTLNYVPPLPVSFLSSNTLPIIRHSAFPGVAEYFSSGENYFFSLKRPQTSNNNKKIHPKNSTRILPLSYFREYLQPDQLLLSKTVFTGIS